MIITLHPTPHIHLPASCPLFFLFHSPLRAARVGVAWGHLLECGEPVSSHTLKNESSPPSSYHLPTAPTLGEVSQELLPHLDWDFGWFNCVSLPS